MACDFWNAKTGRCARLAASPMLPNAEAVRLPGSCRTASMSRDISAAEASGTSVAVSAGTETTLKPGRLGDLSSAIFALTMLGSAGEEGGAGFWGGGEVVFSRAG